MCGRYERRGDKQKIAEAFYAKGGLDEVDFGEDFDCAPGSIQPVVWMNKEGEVRSDSCGGGSICKKTSFQCEI
jgi:hypothetical protein